MEQTRFVRFKKKMKLFTQKRRLCVVCWSSFISRVMCVVCRSPTSVGHVVSARRLSSGLFVVWRVIEILFLLPSSLQWLGWVGRRLRKRKRCCNFAKNSAPKTVVILTPVAAEIFHGTHRGEV